jgi:F-type H+-transporting ATPase subunit delta
MIEIRLGDRYAKSILGLAIERGVVDEIRRDFLKIESICNSNPDFVQMLKSPIINSDKKRAVLAALFDNGSHEITKLFLNILVTKKREGFLRDVAMRFLSQYDLYRNITRGQLVSAAPLSAAQKASIMQVVASELKTTFELEEKIDPELVGGFTLRVGDLLFDASISARLRKLSQEFSKNPYVKQL